jgi:hypothetical protein
MRKIAEKDSNLTLALGLLGATVVAAVVVLVMPAIADRHSQPQTHPSPEIITPADTLDLDTAPVFRPLPKAQRPPETLLNPGQISLRPVASSR